MMPIAATTVPKTETQLPPCDWRSSATDPPIAGTPNLRPCRSKKSRKWSYQWRNTVHSGRGHVAPGFVVERARFRPAYLPEICSRIFASSSWRPSCSAALTSALIWVRLRRYHPTNPVITP